MYYLTITKQYTIDDETYDVHNTVHFREEDFERHDFNSYLKMVRKNLEHKVKLKQGKR